MLTQTTASLPIICSQKSSRRRKRRLSIPSIALMIQRSRTRKQLAKLSSSQLNDIGISEEQAMAEAEQPFWK